MIIDSLENLKRYQELSSEIATCINFINSNDLSKLEANKIELNDRCFVLVQDVDVMDDNLNYEWHKKYIDIQLVVDGSECLDVAVNSTHRNDSFDEIKDIGFCKKDNKAVRVKLYKNEFVLLFPYELHAPCIYLNDKKIKKLVFKILWEDNYA
ncbi:MAG: YhcH/YjgK/YiaL family protein [Anaerorhabdus sp.]